MKKSSIYLGIIILIIGGVVIFLIKKDNNTSFSEVRPYIGNIKLELRETGYVSPRNRLEIKPPVSGRIEEILVVEGQRVKKGEILAWMSSSDRAALLDAARAKGEQEYKKWQDTYKPTPVISPIDGFIILRDKEPGQTVTINDYIVVMADDLIIVADVDETDLRYIKLKQKVEIFLDAFPDQPFNGIVEHIAYESQIINNVTVYKIKILPINHPKEFRTGMTATVKIISQEKQNILLIPLNAVIDKDGEKYVLLKTPSNKPQMQKIKLGISNGKEIEVIHGISEKDVILIRTSSKNISNNSTNTQRRDRPRFGGIPGISRR